MVNVTFLEVDDGVPLYRISGQLNGDCWLNFSVSETTAWGEDFVDTEVVLQGYVKWDGCCDFDVLKSHFCSKGEVENFAALLVKIHEIAAHVIPSWSKELAE